MGLRGNSRVALPQPPHTFGEFVRDARVRMEFTVRQLAYCLQVQPSYISDIEHDRRTPSLWLMTSLASLLELDKDDLIALAGHLGEET